MCFGPLLQAGWANASGVECVPVMVAGTSPQVLFSRRPAAKRATNARARRPDLFVIFNFPVEHFG